MTRLGTVFLALFCASALAADSEDIAFLEFLGSFSDDDGEWLDPMVLEQAAQLESEGVTRIDTGADTTDTHNNDSNDEQGDDNPT